MNKHILACLVAGITITVQAIAATASSETQKNLNTALQGESNAQSRYSLFAGTAAQEGNAQVAKLFRAAAAAEGIHRDAHRATLQKLGGSVEPVTIKPIQPGTTADNLRQAIQGETYERDSMYPKFLATAKKEGAKEALRSFRFASSAEKQHVVLYTDALNTLGRTAAVDYYVCPVCGSTHAGRPTGSECETCGKAVSAFILFS